MKASAGLTLDSEGEAGCSRLGHSVHTEVVNGHLSPLVGALTGAHGICLWY